MRKKTLSTTSLSGLALTPLHEELSETSPTTASRPRPPLFLQPSPVQDVAAHNTRDGGPARADDDDSASTADSTIGNTIPRNPSDAWQLLKDVVNTDSMLQNGLRSEPRGSINGIHAGISTYRLVREGYLTAEIVQMLVRRFAEHYVSCHTLQDLYR